MKLQEAIDKLKELDQLLSIYRWLGSELEGRMPADTDDVHTVCLLDGIVVSVDTAEAVLDQLMQKHTELTTEREKLANTQLKAGKK